MTAEEKRLYVYIEIEGEQNLVGVIDKTDSSEGRFSYASEYLNAPFAAPVSCSLPLQEESFRERETRIFFEGLLPEGFTRRSVAGWIHADTNDYLTILAGLGKECLGAVKILEHPDEKVDSKYVPLSAGQVRELAREGASKSAEIVAQSHLSLAGASGKVGLYYHPERNEWYQPLGDAPSTHIVKQSHVRLEALVTNEQLALMTAGKCGLTVPESFIINLDRARDEDVLLATEWFDRVFSDMGRKIGEMRAPLRLHQEDFAQALEIAAADKYETSGDHYLKKCFDLLRRRSVNPIEDQERLWKILVFDLLIGNTDNHIKNLSLLYGRNLQSVRLAPAYDIVSTCVYDAGTRDMAVYLGEECSLDRITRHSLLQAAEEVDLGERLVMRWVDELAGRFEESLKAAADELSDLGFPKAPGLRELILERGGYSTL